MSQQVNKNPLVISDGSKESEAKLAKAIASIEARNGLEPPRGPQPEQGASNSTAIFNLRLAIERTQARASETQAIIRGVKQSLKELEAMERSLRKQEQQEVKSLMQIVRIEKMTDEQIQELLHELGQDCENDKCQDCCPHDHVKGGFCAECEADLNGDIAARNYDRAKDARKYGHD